MKGVGLTIGFWAAAEIVSGGSPDPLQAFTTPKSKMMEELSRLGIRCVDANADPKKFIETYLGGSTGTSAALDSLAIFVPKAHLTHPTPHGLPKQLQSAAYGGNMYHACDLWKKLVDAGGDFSRIEDLGLHRVYEPTGEYAVYPFTSDEYPVVRVVTEGPNGVEYRTTKQGHPRAAVLAASTLARDQPAEVDLRDELYKHLDDHALVELWRKKKKGRLPRGAIASGANCANPTYDRALLLRKLQENGIAPDPPSDEA